MFSKVVLAEPNERLVIHRDLDTFWVQVIGHVQGIGAELTDRVEIDRSDLERLATGKFVWESGGVMIWTADGKYHVYRHGEADISGKHIDLRIAVYELIRAQGVLAPKLKDRV